MASIAGQKISGSINAATTTGTPFQPIANKPFNVFLTGAFTGSVSIVRSYDGGLTWLVVLKPDLSTAATFTAAANMVAIEPDAAVLWAIQTGTFTPGTPVAYSIGS